MTFDEERLTGVGGGDAPGVVGVSPWDTAYDVYLKKLGQAPPRPATEPMVWGTLVEPLIRDEYMRRTGRAVEEMPMLRHPTHQFMIAHLDGQIVEMEHVPGVPVPFRRILEIKTTRTPHGWGEPGTDEIPLHYLVQVHHYLVVSGAQLADVAVLIGGNDFRLYEVRADAEIARELVTAEYAFWRRVEAREPPDPSNTQDAIRRWGGLAAAGRVVAGEAELLAVERMLQIRTQRKQLEGDEDEARLQLMQALGEHGDHLVDEAGTLLATWRLDRGRKAYTREVEARDPQRRFLLKG